MSKALEYYVSIDSRDRNRTQWPASSRFEVRFEPDKSFSGATIHRAFRNVESIEVVEVVYPNTNNVLDQMYLMLSIPEIDGNIECSYGSINRPLAKLVPSYSIGNYIVCKFPDDDARPRKKFQSPGARIDKMTFELRSYDNSIFSFGTDTSSPTPPNPLLQVSVTLKIIVNQPYIV
jgi:hypothetical protein